MIAQTQSPIPLQPMSGTPRTDHPGSDTPKIDNPKIDSPGSDSPGSGTPGIDSPNKSSKAILFDYRQAANPIRKGLTEAIPLQFWGAQLHANGPTGVIPWI